MHLFTIIGTNDCQIVYNKGVLKKLLVSIQSFSKNWAVTRRLEKEYFFTIFYKVAY